MIKVGFHKLQLADAFVAISESVYCTNCKECAKTESAVWHLVVIVR